MRNSEISNRTSDNGRPAFAPLRSQPDGRGPQTEKTQSGINIQVRSLKVLAMTLLREIERLEMHPFADTKVTLDLRDYVQRFEAELIRSALITTGGRQRRAACILGMKVTTLNSKIKRYGIKLDDLDGSEGARCIEPFASTHSM